jgi:PadR family transcriptional regulator, regulatory protein PadR
LSASPPSEWTSQLRRGALELCVLGILRAEASYGYEIVATLGKLGPLAANENTVYPLLRRLKNDAQLETITVESPSGPVRQYYRLTAQGRRRLQALEKTWTELARAVELSLSNGGAS